MKILLLGAFSYPHALEEFYRRAFIELGHEVVLDPDSKADVSVVVKWFPPEHVEELPKPRCLIFPDNTGRYKDYYESVGASYDFVFLAHREPMIDGKRVFHLPCAYDPTDHRYYPCERDIDLIFIGTCHLGREWIRDVPGITVYGNGWGPNIKSVTGEEKARLYSRSKIILNSTLPDDTCNMRFYEALACGGMLLTDKWDEGFEPGVHFVTYRSYEDLLKQVDKFLHYPMAREMIAQQGMEKVRPHTYSARAKYMLEAVKSV